MDFEIQGPDDNGHVWICSTADVADGWCRNLGSKEAVVEVFSQWLGEIDADEARSV